MAQKTQAAYFWMTYCGYIHTDLHDGNVFYHIDSEDDSSNKIIIVDFGLVFELDEKKESSLHIQNFRYMSNKDNKGLQILMKNSLDTSLYSHIELLEVCSKIDKLNLLDKDLKNINMIEYADDILKKLNKTGAVLRTPELYCFLGLILVCREFLDNDGKPFDVLISSINLLSNAKDKEVNRYAKELNSYILNIW
jgi:predicted unusual protein kinase regulating ubiquinone biosynthesis (AarF/ABC1/UbiB family)